ncbi:hypothetical protein CVT25_012412 [Psilocybe cyanescens]|uniref:Uncharacterized protein n=1 Tax=Psilocybe cyanescens TaxID=93625 RepID=A0A409X7R8_PSICY|nr:hypothetical protein CVT25_012412 [Psilocybe cyanescens]
MSIIFYNIPSISQGYSISPNTWRTLLPYTPAEWVETSDIKALYEKLGVIPSKKPDRSPHYTHPMIYDPSTDKYSPDSLAIAVYLDAQYPESDLKSPARGRIFPSALASVIKSFSAATMPHFQQV